MNDIRDDKDIKTLVHAFYDNVRQDDRLGYIFNDFAQVDWEQHLPLPVRESDFERWLDLFRQTVDTHFTGPNAENAKEMAGKIASSFSLRMKMEDKYENPSLNL